MTPAAGGSTTITGGSPPPPVSAAIARYLEAAYYLRGEGEHVRRGRLAAWLDVSAPSVTQASRQMIRDGLLIERPDHTLEFTVAGEKAASDLVRRHRIIEAWLVAALDLDWATADEEAQRLAHAMSDAVLDRIHERLGRPRACPHGNPIPGEIAPTSPSERLVELAPGHGGRVQRISEVAEHDTREVLAALYAAGLTPTAEVTLVRLHDDGATVNVRGRQLRLDPLVAGAVWITQDESVGVGAGA